MLRSRDPNLGQNITKILFSLVFSYVGFVIGALMAIAIGYLIVQQGRKVNLKYIFKYTTLLLVFLSAGMVAYGTHELEEYLVKSDQIKKEEIYQV